MLSRISYTRSIARQFNWMPKAPIVDVVNRCLPIESAKGRSYLYKQVNDGRFKVGAN